MPVDDRHGTHGVGCAYGIVDCTAGDRCRPKEACPLGRTVFRNRWTNAGHHHYQKEDDSVEEQ